MSDHDRITAEYIAALDAGEGVIHVRDTVICDRCDTDMTNDPRSGGFIFGTYAYGPCCCDDALISIRRYNEESHIRQRCPNDVSFADWIRAMRGTNPKIVVSKGRSPGSLT